MGYQALLFCPDEKTSRTVTQVLGELEFSVVACAEPFAAVKKLMSDHFDALVVDCDNEQNATLLFKSARNSSSNQTALAVAVVEGQAGVAKAFRFGANLVLTKPINVEQAKGTLRVARGLLRKGEPAKPATPGAAVPASASSGAPAAAPAKPSPAASTPVRQPVTPSIVKPTVSSLPPKPVPASAVAAAKQAPAASIPVPSQPIVNRPVANEPDDDLLELGVDDSANPTAASSAPAVAKGNQPQKLTTWIPAASASAAEAKPANKATAASSFGSGAASEPAPALESSHATPVPETKEVDLFEKPVEATASESPSPALTFTFGGAAVEEQSGGNKKILLAVAAVVFVAVGGYFGWNYFQSRTTQSATPVASSHPPQPSQPVQPAASPAATQPAPAQTAPATPAPLTAQTSPVPSRPSAGSATAKSADDTDSADNEEQSTTSSAKKAAAPTSDDKPAASQPAATPLVVKGGKVSTRAAKPAASSAADAPAPSVIGMAVPGSSAPPLNLVSGNATAPRPVLEKLNISQGVSQGLLVKKVSPVYPRSALSMRVEGSVQLLATISKTGDITAVKVLSGDQQLSKAATDAVKQWKYKPYLLNGEPVEIQTQVTINFRLPN